MTKLGEIFIELKLDSKEYKASLKKQKALALKTANEIEKGQVSSNSKTTKSKAAEQKAHIDGLNNIVKYEKQVYDQKKKINDDAIKSSDKASAAIMKNEENINKQKTASSKSYSDADAQAQYQSQERLIKQQGKYAKAQGSAIEMNKKFDKQMKSNNKTVKSSEKGFLQLTTGILKSAPAFAVATAAIAGVYQTLRFLTSEFTAGLNAIEDFNSSVISSSAFITTFSKKASEGDIAGAWDEASVYAKALTKELEIMDAKTIATGKDLRIISDTFIQQGILLDVNNEKQKAGFINLANAIKLMTKGQNQEIQLRQESRALAQGQLKDSNLLVKLLQAKDPEFKKNLATAKKTGQVFQYIGDLLEGFTPASLAFEATWSAIGTSLETIHDRVLRGAFLPTYQKLLEFAVEIKDSLIDGQGELTPLANKIQNDIQKILSVATKVIEKIIKSTFWLISNLEIVVYWFKAIAEITTLGLGISVVPVLTTAIKNLGSAALITNTNMSMLKKTTIGLFSFYAGFKLGQYLYEEFEQVRLFGVGLIDGLIDGWHKFGSSVKILWIEIKQAWKDIVYDLGQLWGDFLMKISDAFVSLPFSWGDKKASEIGAVAKSFKSMTKPLDETAKSIREVTKAEEEWQKGHDKVIDSMVNSALSYKPSSIIPGEAEDESNVSVPELTIPPETEDAIKKKIKKFEDEMKKYVDSLKVPQSILNSFLIGDEKERQDVLDTFQDLRDQLQNAAKEGSISGEKFAEVWRRIGEEEAKALNKLTGWGQIADTLDSYARESMDIFDNLSEVVSSAFSSMEDALVDFITTGEFEFSNFVDSILADIARIAVQESITGPLASALSTSLGGSFSGLFSGGSSSSGLTTETLNFNPATYNAGGKAAGGAVVGGSSYLVGEKGPEVFSPAENGSITPNSNLGGNTTVQVIDQRNGGEDIEVQRSKTNDGEFIKMIIKEVSNDLRSGGDTSKAMTQTFGTRRVGARR
ncbi:MAG: hypothetical protein GQ540_03670 [Lutibacter sp.]|uniref:phage tail tape measure C-terminal domain-containing protein n=1 Tax=Lutibacter sp. TaxID=1925666 RepID=UPI001A0F8C55|nr:phage tail tape measure C-terminal domain-containing protein [Lutibacter sp.]NOR27611.1 hypothetical protein [Lutibacter sp.]